MAEGEPKRSTVVKCEAHGLHYDSATHTGCVICRREGLGGPAPVRPAAAAVAAAPAASAGTGTGTVRPPAAPAEAVAAPAAVPAPRAAVAMPGAAAAAPSRPLGPALLVTALLLLATTFGLFALHAAVGEYLQAFLPGSPPEPQLPAQSEQMEKVQRELDALGQPVPAEAEGAEAGAEEPEPYESP